MSECMEPDCLEAKDKATKLEQLNLDYISYRKWAESEVSELRRQLEESKAGHEEQVHSLNLQITRLYNAKEAAEARDKRLIEAVKNMESSAKPDYVGGEVNSTVQLWINLGSWLNVRAALAADETDPPQHLLRDTDPIDEGAGQE